MSMKKHKLIMWAQLQWDRLLLACKLPDHFMFQIYERIAGGVECSCCIFWRGFLFGMFINAVVIAAAFLFGMAS